MSVPRGLTPAIVATRDWAGGAALNHAGSNTMNYANVWIAPNRDFAVLVCINQGGHAAAKASDEALTMLIAHHLATINTRATDSSLPR